MSRDIELPEPTVGLTNERRSNQKKSDTRSPRIHLELKYTKTAKRFINILEHLGPFLGVIQGGAPHHPNPNAPTFADGDPNHTLCGQKTMQETQPGTGPSSCTEFEEPTWRTKILSSHQRWSGE